MRENLGVLVAVIAFVGSHFLLSHPWRKSLVQRLGSRGFFGAYSIVALVTFGWLVLAYLAAPMGAMLWPVGDVIWVVVSATMVLASVLLVGSLFGNPAMSSSHGVKQAHGVYAITRHPMLWSFALWGACHILVFPTVENLILSSGIIVLSLVGAAAQDSKKERAEPDYWSNWEAQTSYWPFVAIATGRARLAHFGWRAPLGGLILWLGATWAHPPFQGWFAGVWHWLR